MTEDTAADVYIALVKIGDLLKKAKPEQIKSLLNGEARLEIVPNGWTAPKPPPAPRPAKTAKPRPQQPSAPAVEQQLRTFTSSDAATAFLAGQDLNLTQARKLASDLGLRGASRLQIDEVFELIVRTFVGARLDSEALQRL